MFTELCKTLFWGKLIIKYERIPMGHQRFEKSLQYNIGKKD